MNDVMFNEINKAHARIKSFIVKTPLITSEIINKQTNSNVFFKLENLQSTGSFKIRGASNKILLLNNEEKKRGVVAYSSGNHAQAVAYASKLKNINATIIMPRNAPLIKIKNTKEYGAKVFLYDPEKESREEIALNISKKENKIIIKPYDDLDIIAGQGTIGKEIYEELKAINIEPDIYLCCCGGGGLIAGSSSYLKHIYPKLKNYSVEPDDFNDTQISLEKNLIVSNSTSSKSICDALLAKKPGEITFSINKKNLDRGLSVSDTEVMKTIIELSEKMKIIVEPGGAVAAAALLNKKIDIENKNVVVIISGGNIDLTLFNLIISKQI
jgi:threonine dehydratase|tara:strand:- start:457 stop:1437 length:981 start_codon:yes stop_codon:yes gene_type:complete